MIIVTGCPRSGTSLMMDCLRIGLGENRIIGEKFPQDSHNINDRKKGANELDNHYEARIYSMNRILSLSDIEENIKYAKDMNPNGFWECRYTVNGIQWHLGINVKENDVCKIVSQGLFYSDPKYIDKIIYMIRHPRQVAKSQERLRRMFFLSAKQESEIKVHTPEMFIGSTAMAARWILENNSKPILPINFDNLISNPDFELNKVSEFLKEGDFSNHPIDSGLKRSYPEEVENDLWVYAEEIYRLLCNLDWEGIVNYHDENIKYITKSKRTTFCTRINRTMFYNQCLNCQKSISLRKNLKSESERKGLNWRKEPCIFECLTTLEEPLKSIKESIENNSWNKT